MLIFIKNSSSFVIIYYNKEGKNMKAFVTGISGQDGSYLVELLLEKGYEVHGTIRRASVFNTQRIDHLMQDEKIYNKKLFLHHGDVTDPVNINQLISSIRPDEVYNLAAQSHVKVSFEVPYYTAQTDALGTLNVLEAVRNHCPSAKVYQASTSELYGGMGYNMPSTGYTEESPMHPRSPYGCAKIYGLWIVKNYREAYGMYACNGILFNHESPRRGDTFVTKKITNWMRKFATATLKSSPWSLPPLELGNLNAKRDWGHAKDYVEAMWLMLQQDKPKDFVIATNKTYSVKDFINECFDQMGWLKDMHWEGSGVNERLVWNSNNGPSSGLPLVVVNPKYFRPSEVEVLLGDATKAQKELGWTPKYDFKGLVKDMLSN
jgi:GDPmannose 4,6-dehydratase